MCPFFTQVEFLVKLCGCRYFITEVIVTQADNRSL